MRILITTDTFTPAVNGVVTSTTDLCRQLLDRGHDVRLVAPAERPYRAGHIEYVRSLRVPIYPGARLCTSNLIPRGIVRELVDWKPDIVHSQTEFSTFITARNVASHSGAARIHTYHTLYEQYTSYFSPSQRLGEKFVSSLSHSVLKGFDAIVAPSTKTERVLRGYGLGNRIAVIPSGIDLARFRTVPEDARNTIRARHGIGADAPVVLMVGRLGAEKRMDAVIDRFPELLRMLPDARLLIVGDGPDARHLMQLVEARGIERAVVFTGPVGREEIASYYHAADLFTSASRSETQGLTYLEASACGLPLVAQRDECLEGVLIEGINGSGFSDVADLPRLAYEILTDADLKREMSVAAAELSNAFDVREFGARMERLYEESVENRHDRQRTGLIRRPFSFA